jgi:hypothetical protein
MVLRLDPSLPLVWRSPTSVQVGVEQPRVLQTVTPHDEFALDLLSRGIARPMLESLLAERGAPDDTLPALLAGLDGAVLTETTLPDPGRLAPLHGVRVAVDGRGLAAEALAQLLRLLGAGLGEPDSEPDLAVVISSFATAPRRTAGWLRDDVPHLLVEFGERTVRAGPVVVPGAGPCARCIEQHRTDIDPAWPIVASQLCDRTAPAADALGIGVAASLSAQVIVDHLASPALSPWRNTVVAWHHPVLGAAWPQTAEPGAGWAARVFQHVAVRMHPACGCRSPEGNATASAEPPAGIPPPPTRARAGVWPG